MLSDGFVLNYRAGAKGDFLMRFLNDMDPAFSKNGKTDNYELFNSLRTFEIAVREESVTLGVQYRRHLNKLFPGWLDQQSSPIIELAHRLHRLDNDNLDILKSKCRHVYTLLIDVGDATEAEVNVFIKNAIPLEIEKVEAMRAIDPRFNGYDRNDKHFFLQQGIYDFNDEKRIALFLENIKGDFEDFMENLNSQLAQDTERVTYKGLFNSPYPDMIHLYHTLHEREPDIGRYEELLAQTSVPKELTIYNHRIRIDYQSDSIITVLGKV